MMRLRILSILALLPFALALRAQQVDKPPDTPVQSNVPHDTSLNPALPTLFIVGDSTARNGANLGWGDHFAQFFDTSRVNIANRAVAGRSSRTYVNEGLWDKALAQMKSGDYLLLQMGHNDGGDLDGAKPRGSLKGIGDESRDVPQTAGPFAGKTETVHTYGWYMRKMIDEAKAKGVHPVLLTTTIRNIWKDGQIERDMGYTGWIKQIAAQEDIPLIDMASVEADRLQALGPDATAKLFPIDHTHSTAENADLIAKDVVTALRNAHSPLVSYLKAP